MKKTVKTSVKAGMEMLNRRRGIFVPTIGGWPRPPISFAGEE